MKSTAVSREPTSGTVQPAPSWKKPGSGIPFKQADSPSAMLPSLLLGLALMTVAGWLWLRPGRGQPGGQRQQLARVLESHRLGPKSTVAVVEFAGQLHLVAQTEHAVASIAQVSAATTAKRTEQP